MQKAAAGTQRIGAQAKQAAKKVQKAAPKPLVGTKRIGASPPKPKASSGGGGTGLFGFGPTGELIPACFPHYDEPAQKFWLKKSPCRH